jgi:hypothetical protein
LLSFLAAMMGRHRVHCSRRRFDYQVEMVTHQTIRMHLPAFFAQVWLKVARKIFRLYRRERSIHVDLLD